MEDPSTYFDGMTQDLNWWTPPLDSSPKQATPHTRAAHLPHAEQFKPLTYNDIIKILKFLQDNEYTLDIQTIYKYYRGQPEWLPTVQYKFTVDPTGITSDQWQSLVRDFNLDDSGNTHHDSAIIVFLSENFLKKIRQMYNDVDIKFPLDDRSIIPKPLTRGSVYSIYTKLKNAVEEGKRMAQVAQEEYNKQEKQKAWKTEKQSEGPKSDTSKTPRGERQLPYKLEQLSATSSDRPPYRSGSPSHQLKTSPPYRSGSPSHQLKTSPHPLNTLSTSARKDYAPLNEHTRPISEIIKTQMQMQGKLDQSALAKSSVPRRAIQKLEERLAREEMLERSATSSDTLRPGPLKAAPDRPSSSSTLTPAEAAIFKKLTQTAISPSDTLRPGPPHRSVSSVQPLKAASDRPSSSSALTPAEAAIFKKLTQTAISPSSSKSKAVSLTPAEAAIFKELTKRK